MSSEKIIAKQKEVEQIIEKLSKNILQKNPKDLVIVGIHTRGVFIAQRILENIRKTAKQEILNGVLDITLYRDDVDSIDSQPVAKETKIDFDITDKNVVLIDDVLYTGRSIRAAMDELMDFGRPKTIQLAVVVDRGHRELPIQADYVGKIVVTDKNQTVCVQLKETDKTDQILLKQKG